MNIKFLNKFYIFIFLSLLFNQSATTLYFDSYIKMGYDSNPLRLSDDEIDYSQNNQILLNGASEIYSNLFTIYSKLSYAPRIINKRKTKFSLSVKLNQYLAHPAKSNESINFNISQSLGSYQSLSFNYFLMPDFYLREYRDTDIIINNDFNYLEITDSLQSTYFNLEKIKLGYQFPVLDKKTKLKFELVNEKQYYDQNFTEFDLDISGISIVCSNSKFSFLFGDNIAINSSFLDGVFSTYYMDRGYKQKQYKISYNWDISNNRDLRFLIDIYNRKYSSDIYNDNLHRTRKHNDCSYSLSYAFYHSRIKNKLTFTYRTRKTSSNFEWVEKLKTFERFYLIYSLYFNKQKINLQ